MECSSLFFLFCHSEGSIRHMLELVTSKFSIRFPIFWSLSIYFLELLFVFVFFQIYLFFITISSFYSVISTSFKSLIFKVHLFLNSLLYCFCFCCCLVMKIFPLFCIFSPSLISSCNFDCELVFIEDLSPWEYPAPG